MIIDRIQRALQEQQLDGWLFFDHHRRDELAYRILGLADTIESSRRWYYFVPATGQPRKLVHRIESTTLDAVPGEKLTYAKWEEQQQRVHEMVAGSRRIAMQYSQLCAIPYVSLVDAGTIELVRSAGVQIVSSADLVQEFEACWTAEQFEQHKAAGKLVDKSLQEAFDLVGERLGVGDPLSEYEVQQFIAGRFARDGLFASHGPIVAVNGNASNPHYEPTRERSTEIKRGDLLLIDLWAKLKQERSVYYDITWTAFCGQDIPSNIAGVFEVVRDARKRACAFVIDSVGKGRETAGFEVDDQARKYIDEKGFGEYFFHRTGHSIGTEVHGSGANMDNLESHDERHLLPGTCFSVEPGIYLPEFGIRSEVNVFVGDGYATVTGPEQDFLVRI